MRARWMLALLAIAGALAGCGSSAHGPRQDVAAYIKRVNAIESQLAAPLRSVTSAGAQLASGGKAGGSLSSLSALAQEQTLDRALVRIRALTRRLASLPVPPPAVRLRRLLLSLESGQAALTAELASLGHYLPRFASTLAGLAPATRRLRIALAVTQPLGTGQAGVSGELDVKARAVDSYRSKLIAIGRALAALPSPPVLAPQHTAEVRTLTAMAASAGRLAQGLRSAATNVAALLVAFERAAVGNDTLAVQRAEIAAIRAYDKRVAGLNTLQGQVQVEQTRLSATLQ